jgi:Tol biopolymer transport system component
MKFKKRIDLRFVAIIITILLSIPGCQASKVRAEVERERIGSLPPTAQILFVSNRDTKTRRNEIYTMDADGNNVTRLTFTEEHHFIMGIDRSRRYIVTSRAVEDTRKPKGLGSEDSRSLWVIDLETKKEIRLSDLRYHAEGRSFSPDGQWIVFLMKPGDKKMDIYKIRRDGSQLTRLTNTPMALEGDCSFSPDGTRSVFNYLYKKAQNLSSRELRPLVEPGSTMDSIWARRKVFGRELGQWNLAYF